MKVKSLQQYLCNLLLPLEDSGASRQNIGSLERACQGFDPFRDKDVAEFAEFLTRAADYERDGKWPSLNPPIAGHIVDEPSAREYAQRLRTFLEREAPSGTPIADRVREMLNGLSKQLKLKQIKEIAKELQVAEDFKNAKQGIEKIVLQLTGQNLSGKKSTASPRRKAAKPDLAPISQYAAELRNLAGSDELEQRLNELTPKLKTAGLRELAEFLGATGKSRTKTAEWVEIILGAVKASPSEENGEATGSAAQDTSSSDGKVTRLVEVIVAALKSKADGPDAPHDEIDAELQSLAGQMDRDEAVAVAKRIGIVRHLTSRNEALEEIRRKVFEMKRARESLAY